MSFSKFYQVTEKLLDFRATSDYIKSSPSKKPIALENRKSMLLAIVNLNDYISIEDSKDFFNSSVDNSIRLITDISIAEVITGQIIEESKTAYYFWKLIPDKKKAIYAGSLYKETRVDRHNLTCILTPKLSEWLHRNAGYISINNVLKIDKKPVYQLL